MKTFDEELNDAEFDISEVKKEPDDFETYFKRKSDEWDKEHPFLSWFDRGYYNHISSGKGIMGYAPHVLIKEPWLIIEQILYEIKWAYQRVARKYDDRVIFDTFSYLDDIMPRILRSLKEIKNGIPADFFEGMEYDENHSYSDESHEKAKELWDVELDKMIEGFKASKIISDLDYDWKNKEEEQRLYQIFNDGMQSFVKHYHSLWD